jgi:hypothetical protein
MHKIQAKHLTDDEVDSESDEEDIKVMKHNMTHDEIRKVNKESFVNDDKLNSTDIEYLNTNFNYENLILIENLYSRLIKDFEMKRGSFDSIVLTWYDFISLNYDTYNIMDLFKDKNLNKNFKMFFVFELIIFSLTYMREMKNEQIFNAFKTCIFYLHQNFIVVMYLILSKTPKDVLNKNELAKKCKGKVDENNIFVNKSTFKSIFINNNKSIHQIISNLITLIKKNTKDDINEQRNITLIMNYLKNSNIYKIQTIKNKLYEKVNPLNQAH